MSSVCPIISINIANPVSRRKIRTPLPISSTTPTASKPGIPGKDNVYKGQSLRIYHENEQQ